MNKPSNRNRSEGFYYAFGPTNTENPGISEEIPGFCFGGEGGICLIKVSFPSNRERATVHRTVAFYYSNPSSFIQNEKEPTRMGQLFSMAEKEGFELDGLSTIFNQS